MEYVHIKGYLKKMRNTGGGGIKINVFRRVQEYSTGGGGGSNGLRRFSI